MTKLLVACSNCELEFAVRDNGYADPAGTIWCPLCGSRELRRATWLEAQAGEHKEAV
jgi:hypothetical protein